MSRQLDDGCLSCNASAVLCDLLQDQRFKRYHHTPAPCCDTCARVGHRTPTDSPHPETTPTPKTAVASESTGLTGQSSRGEVQA